jgi:hypothetical protein
MSRIPLPTEKDIVTRLRRGEVAFPPFAIEWEDPLSEAIDGVLCLKWQKNLIRFAAACKRVSNPKAVDAAAEQARTYARAAGLRPLVVFPFLDEAALTRLEEREVSGIDLCGNGLVIVPGEWYVRRTGSPNRFRAEGAIKNVYRGGSSVVARLFLAKPEFDSVQGALAELVRRGGRVTLATVSKVCKRLEEDLIVERKRGGVTSLRLIQPEKLIDRLAADFVAPVVTTRVAGKLQGIDGTAFRAQLREWAEKSNNQVAQNGASAIAAYAVMARSGPEEYYCTDVAGAVRALGKWFQPTERFATVNLLETSNDEVYFDRRDDLTASPVQTFLELSAGDKRDQETAVQVRKVILNAVSPQTAK